MKKYYQHIELEKGGIYVMVEYPELYYELMGVEYKRFKFNF